MVDENLTDQQQADLVRRWFRENGTFILGGVAVGLAALYGWSQWNSYEVQHAEEASGIYEELVGMIQASDQDQADSLLAELESGYSGSPYIDQARLRLAKLSLDRSDFEVAASHLESIVAKSGSAELLHIARIRLARIRLQQEQYDAALTALEGTDADSAFYAQVNNVRGDIYVALDRADEALAAYDAALTDPRQPPSIDRAFVQAKRDRLDVNDAVTDMSLTMDSMDEAGDASTAVE